MVGATMSHNSSLLLALAGNFALMSLFAMGGANAAFPEMYRVAVDVMHWMSDRQFADLYAIAQITPGPNVIVVTLIGYHVAGLAGALVATLAMCGPTCVFAFFVGRAWDRFKEARWRGIIQAALVPISLGLLGASTLVIARIAGQTWRTVALMLLAAAVSYQLRLNPLWIFAAAALLGIAGAV
jgi:chromate transporter